MKCPTAFATMAQVTYGSSLFWLEQVQWWSSTGRCGSALRSNCPRWWSRARMHRTAIRLHRPALRLGIHDTCRACGCSTVTIIGVTIIGSCCILKSMKKGKMLYPQEILVQVLQHADVPLQVVHQGNGHIITASYLMEVKDFRDAIMELCLFIYEKFIETQSGSYPFSEHLQWVSKDDLVILKGEFAFFCPGKWTCRQTTVKRQCQCQHK